MNSTITSSSDENASSLIESILYSAGTDVGMRREENQDSYGIMLGDGYRLFIVADGMGGVKGGSIASNLTIAVIEKTLRDRAHIQIEDVVDAIDKANAEVYKKGSNDEALQGMGTTIAALFVTPTAAYTIHVGDSRIYQVAQSSIRQLTEDHTLVQELVRSGAITEDQAEHHPVAHMLTRSIGPSEKIEIEVHVIQPVPKAGDKFLICSDGLFNLVKLAEIAEIVSEVSTDEAVQYLIDLANERGGTDNITILIVDSNKYAPLKNSSPKKNIDPIEAPVRLLEAIEVVSEPSSGMKGGYHSTNEVVEPRKESIKEVITDKLETDQPKGQEIVHLVEAAKEENELNPFIPETVVSEISEENLDAEVAQESLEDVDLLNIQPAISRRYILVGSGFIGGLLASYLLFATLSRNHSTRQDEEPSIEVANVLETTEPSKVLEQVTLAPSSPLTETVKIGPAEKASVIKRRRDLEISLRDINVRLELLDAEKSSDVQDLQRNSARKAEELSGKIEQLKTDIEVSIRQLATWYDRKRRLETSDKVNMASELASTIPSIKTKKEEFEKITWDYLKEVEALRYNQADPLRDQVLADLAKKRADKMHELSDEVRRAIEKALESADDTVAELTLQRSALEKELDNVRQELDFARTIMTNDSIKIDSTKQTLITRKNAATTELNELQRLLTDN
jgi:serine/threonine protein phosphatase PrpC